MPPIDVRASAAEHPAVNPAQPPGEDQWIVLQTEDDQSVLMPIERILRVTVSAGGGKRAAGFAIEDVVDEAGSGVGAVDRTSSD